MLLSDLVALLAYVAVTVFSAFFAERCIFVFPLFPVVGYSGVGIRAVAYDRMAVRAAAVSRVPVCVVVVVWSSVAVRGYG